ncbi:MAG: YifB family Mg chelatase-like AAA ATPase [Nocardioidaceae bacterium]
MTYHASAFCIAMEGMRGHLVDVQADLSEGAVTYSLVGRPDASVREATERCRAAVANSGFTWPATQRVTILLSPANLRKSGPHYDLAIAVAVLGAKGTFQREELLGTVLLGELMLDGRIRAVPGVLPMVLAAQAAGLHRVIVPETQAGEAELVEGVDVVGLRSLAQVVAFLRRAEQLPEAPPTPAAELVSSLRWRGEDRTADLDMAEVVGMADARFALEVAAAGGHHVALCGPKGAGKTTLAERVPSLLPDLRLPEALELSSIRSLAGTLAPGTPIPRRPPFRAPHHSATRASVLGGGAGRTRPGEVSQALHGCLFLDEFPLFAADIIESLREPLENREVTIARGEETATYPARTMFVLAYNPCPCGDYRADAYDHLCVCTEPQRRRYRSRLSGPITDRIDITRFVLPIGPHELNDPLAAPESSATIRGRVHLARERQAQRYADTPWRVNADVPRAQLRELCPPDPRSAGLLDGWLTSGKLTFRGCTRVHRLAVTVADLAGLGRPGPDEFETAFQLRVGEPLPLSRLAGVAS